MCSIDSAGSVYIRLLDLRLLFVFSVEVILLAREVTLVTSG